MPVPEEVMVQHIVKVYPGDVVPGVHCTSIWTQEQATTADVIERVLEKLTILGEPDTFDLVEIYNEAGSFPDSKESRGRSRTLQEFESPVKVQRDWQFKRGLDGSVGEYRIYLRQKVDNLVGDKLHDVKVTWVDGLCSPTSADEWNFDPDYREEEEIDDLVDLPVLNENILLENLQKRFKRGRIYTYVGGILLAINPFKYFPIYNPKYVLSYQHRNLGELPPHIFAIADIAYHRMLKDRKNQCIVISGESGSGKTESTKLVLHHLTALSHKTQATVLERTILAAGPVLEAFGNAKTCHNNNSSRFGKFTEITYRADGVVCGAVLRKYLLEKSRIVAQADSERNYHVFYYLLVGANASERQALHLQKPEDYAYLNKSQCYTIDRVDESYDFLRLQDSMRSIGFSGEVQQRLFTVLSAVLQIGNVEFIPKERSEDAVTINDNGAVDIISSLLKVDKQILVDVFTVRRTVTRGEVLIRPYKEAEAIATRDGMAKALYGSVFDWIVLQINQTLKSRHNPRMSDVKAYSIGVLDIFGFEDFEMNSFEQFCINFANENLQFYLNQHIFKIRQDEYLSEGLLWDTVAFVDNESCLELINGKPVGLINLLDEECSLSMGTDESLLAKFNKHHSSNSHYEKPPTKEPAFRIVHYAGVVKYKIKDFKAKNQDLMRNDIVMSLKNSKMLFVRKLLGSDPMAVYRWLILRHVICALALFRKAGEARRNGGHFLRQNKNTSWAVSKSPTERKRIRIPLDKETSKQQREVYRKATKVLNRREHQRKKYHQIRNGMERLSTYDVLETYATSTRTRSMKCPTVIGQFQNSLSELMETLNKSHPFFVRCLRSNRDKAPMEFNEEVVLRQLRYTGMLETVKIRQAGYPCRFPINDFVKQYRNLLPKGDLTSNDEVPLCLQSLGLDPNHYQVGKNKVFMRESQYKILREKLQSKLDHAARTIQRWVRAKLDRKRFLQIKKAAITIQAKWRSYVVSKKLLALQRRLAVKRIEEAWLAYLGTRKMRSIKTIQANWRGYLARKKFKSLEKEISRSKEETSQSDTSFDSTWHSSKASCLHCTCPLLTRRRKKFKVIVDVVRHSSFSSKYVKRNSSFRSDSFRVSNDKSKLCPKTVDIMRSSSLRSQAEINRRRRMDIVKNDSFRLWNEVAKKRKIFKKKKAEEKAQEKKEEELAKVSKEEREETKNRAGSLPSIETRNDIRNLEIPEPVALKNKALSTGNLGFARDSHLYESLMDVQEKLNVITGDGFVSPSPRSSGIYDEIDELPTKERTMSTESTGSNSSLGKKRSRDRANKEAVKSNVERRRSFFREKQTITAKSSLGPVTSVGFAIVPPRDSVSERPDYKDSLPVNENKSSLLKMVRNLTNRNKTIKRGTQPKPRTQSPMSSGGKEWKPTKEFVVDGDADLKAFNDFLFKRIADMDPMHKGDDTVAVVMFKKALSQFHSNLLKTYAVVKNRDQTIHLRYEEMSASFANVLELEAEKSKEKLPKDLGMNLFGSIVDDFVKHNSSANSSKKDKTWRRTGGGKKHAKHHHEEFTILNGHKYYLASFSIVTFCEYCNSYIWDRGLVCQGCKFTCHKKCSSRYNTPCRGKSPDNGVPKSIFGAKLSEISGDENPIPKAVEDLMQEIEKNGLYTEGIYRKPGLQTHVKSLKNAISPPDYSTVNFDQYRVHVIASVLKLFFRQLAEPLVPSEFYDDFIRATELPSETEIQTRLCDVIFRFPKPNQDLITRLIFHLAQVAMLEESNKMSPNGLSIIWAPCIMRSSENVDPMDALRQLPLQTRCLEILISRKVANIRRTLADIEALEHGKLTSESALSSFQETNNDSGENRREILKEQIEKMDKERERLTENLPNLERIDSRGDLRIDSDDGITSDDGLTDNDDPMSISFEVSVTTTPLQNPPPGKRRKSPAMRKRANELAPRNDTLSPDSSFEDLSGELGDIPL
ncbi:unconventional myosin-IXAa-like isoform X2 [Rhopilema esculentum]|uniref:unconventional myosin-IXAa-like isoform X2 n=1 Tax=Rhopilema esculentum TaxID=499914 RepID=UPI0031D90DB9